MTTGSHDPLFSVVLVTYNSEEDVVGALESLSAATALPHELIVIDNASQDDTVDVLQSLGVAVHASPTNDGFASACNAGATLASPKADFILLLNPDARPTTGSVDRLVEAARRHPEGGAFGARVLTPGGDLDPSCAMGTMTLWSTFCFGTGLSSAASGSPLFDPESLGGWQRDTERSVPVIPGTMVLLRRSAWDAVGGFDPRYVMYSEDVDLSRRLQEADWSCWLVPSATCTHRSGGSSSAGGKLVLLLRGRVTFARQHFSPFSARLSVGLLLLGVRLRSSGPGVARALPSRRTRRPQTEASAWREAWMRRSEWRDGWSTAAAQPDEEGVPR